MAGTSRNEIAWIVDEKECWVCCSHRPNSRGHCSTVVGGKLTPIHRIYFEKYKYKIPEGYNIVQSCGNKKCLNPDHLEAVTKHFQRRKKPVWEVDSNGCWNVVSHKPSSKGYISLNRNGKNKSNSLLHRIHYIKYKGEIPDGLIVRHTCDNRLCVNPDHLILGTIKDNAMDAVERNRTVFGEKNHFSKLTENNVRDILQSTEKYKVLAERYGVHKGHIGHIKQGLAWKRVALSIE